MTVPDIEIADPNTVVPTRPRRTASCLFKPRAESKLRKIPSSIKRTMNDVPETGSIPVSPMTRTAIAPKRNVVMIRTVAKMKAAAIGKPPTQKMRIIERKVSPMKIGMCMSGHSYQPFPSMYSCEPSPLKAAPMSLKMFAKVLHIFASPNIPPPTIEPIAMVRTVFENAIICKACPLSLAYDWIGTFACIVASYTGKLAKTANGTRKNQPTRVPRLTKNATRVFMNHPIANMEGVKATPT